MATEFTGTERRDAELPEANPQRLVWGILLVFAGFFFLIQNFGLLGFLDFIPEIVWSLFWTGVFGMAGLVMLAVIFLNRTSWWLPIPGFALLGLAGTILASEVLTFIPFEGSIFLGSLGMGFFTVFVLNRELWWALIPGGVLSTLAVVAALDEATHMDTGGVFFLGLAGTFGLVALAPSHRTKWAWIPAGVMLVLALVVFTSAQNFVGMLWPLALVVAGAFTILRSLSRR